jgi:hypothetical protein
VVDSDGDTEWPHLGRQTNRHGGGSSCSATLLVGRMAHTGPPGGSHPTGPRRLPLSDLQPQRRPRRAKRSTCRPQVAQLTLADLFLELPRASRAE